MFYHELKYAVLSISDWLFHLLFYFSLLFIITVIMGRVKITHQKKVETKALLEVGLSQRQAARVSNMPQKCVFGVSKELKQDLPLSNSVGQGRRKATPPHDDRQLLRIMKKDRTKSTQMLSAEWALSNG